MIRNSFLLALEDTGFNVETACSGEEGIEKEGKMRFDLIFLDLRMPGLNGVETLEIIRSKNGNVPVYIVTAFHKEYFSEIKTLKERGVEFELMQKPIGGEGIVAVASGVLGPPGFQL